MGKIVTLLIVTILTVLGLKLIDKDKYTTINLNLIISKLILII